MSQSMIPSEIAPVMSKAVRLQRWNLFWTFTTIIATGLVLGQSQTMKTVWLEDMFSMVPPIAFLVAVWLERKPRSLHFPFGFARVNSLGFFFSAVALGAVGMLLLYGAVSALLAAEHVSIGSTVILGQEIWMGWLMIAAQFYSIFPPLVIGRLQLPLARQLNDKLLYTCALMNSANWLTSLAGIGGIIGIALGWWWADALAAGIISVDIIRDGIKALRSSTAELIDGAPRELASTDLSQDAQRLCAQLCGEFPGATVRLRETGRLIQAEVHGVMPAHSKYEPQHYWPGKDERNWRLAQVSFVPPRGSETASSPHHCEPSPSASALAD